jgi:protein-S-isoprenylcysteine O-methyltransferase Ste14
VVIDVTAQLTLAVWMLLEVGLLVRDRVRGMGSTARDRGTMWLNFLVIAVATAASGVLTGALGHGAWQFGTTGLIVTGLLVMWVGLAVRIWAIAVLGRSFRMTVEVDDDQRVVDSGPYRWVRHPSYAGILLIVIGLGLVEGNWAALAVLIVAPTTVLVNRIFVEEAVLVEVLGRGYADYATRTRRLVPGLW